MIHVLMMYSRFLQKSLFLKQILFLINFQHCFLSHIIVKSLSTEAKKARMRTNHEFWRELRKDFISLEERKTSVKPNYRYCVCLKSKTENSIRKNYQMAALGD